jgi:hypothetical protein
MTEALRQALEAFGERLGRQQVVCLASPGDEVAVGGADWVFVKAATWPPETLDEALITAGDAVVVLVGDHPPGTLGEGARVDFWVRPGPEQAQIRDLSLPYLDLLRQRIAGMAGRREALKMDMEAWFDQNPQKVFPRMAELADVDARLSHLDSCFKRQWDARYGK